MSSWEAAVAYLQIQIAGPADSQIALAQQIGLQLDETLPVVVAGSLLRTSLQEALKLDSSIPTQPGSYELLGRLERDLGVDPHRAELIESQADVEAWIAVRHAQRSIQYLQELQPNTGDLLSVEKGSNSFEGEVSSIGLDGKIFFRGGAGRCAWPHQASMIHRTGSIEYSAKQLAIENTLAITRLGSSYRFGRSPDLSPFEVNSRPTIEDLAALERTLESAPDEAPLQRLFEERRCLLAHLVPGNHATFVIPQAKLANQYVADFLIAGVSSRGFTWCFVEIESPKAPLQIRDGQASKQLRKALHQIGDWREWITNNISSAQKPKSKDGLGLKDIRADADGLVLISRANASPDSSVLRNQIWTSQRVQVRTYDWIVRMARENTIAGPHLGVNQDEAD